MAAKSFLRSPLGVIGDAYSGDRMRGVVAAIDRTFSAIAAALSRHDYQPKTITSADSPYTMEVGINYIVADTSGGSITVNLPPSVSGFHCILVKSAAANTLTLDGNGSETINGSATLALTTQWDNAFLVGVGGNWVRT